MLPIHFLSIASIPSRLCIAHIVDLHFSRIFRHFHIFSFFAQHVSIYLAVFDAHTQSSLEWSSSSSLSSSFLNQPVLQNRTFSDLNRMHAELPPSHLEHLAQSMAFNTATADSTALENARTNYLLRVNSTRESAIAAAGLTNNSGSSAGNRMLEEAFDRDTPEEVDDNGKTAGWKQTIGDWNHQGQSILQNPTLIVSTQQYDRLSTTKRKNKENSMIQAEREADQAPTIDVKSTHWEVAHQTAEVVREFLTIREKCRSTDNEIRSLEASMALQQAKANKLKEEINKIGENSTITAVEKIETIENYKADHQGSDRVISQLARKLVELNSGQAGLKSDLINLESQARSLDKRRRSIVHAFRDPFQSWKGSLSKNSRVGGSMTLQSIVGRELGLCRGRSSQKKFRSSLPTGPSPAHFLEFRKNLLSTRLSHAVTINAHLTCPVYCLRFDRTGRYFITGADDFLLKVFYLGAAQSCKRHNGMDKNRRLRCNYGANFRGAVLVCTLKGHAGVINDINVSMDNCFLATASVDGDVRVWGLKNGCPVAILRGHKGGANMVSWSKLTPYRLVSTGSDGFARVWDIREACLKRYASMVSQRGEYNLRLTNEEKKAKNESQKVSQKAAGTSVVPDLLPPLPVREGSSSNLASPVDARNNTIPAATLDSSIPQPLQPPEIAQAAVPSEQPASRSVDNNNGNQNGIIVPPLPAAVPPLGQGADGENQNGGGPDGDVAPGQFVANDLIDEGVRLLSRYQHGNIQEEHGPGTRSRRSAVNVICVARCPLGKQFVTGSDDGICRVWEDFDDSSVAIIDARLSNRNQETILRSAEPSQSGVESQPLLKLMGHVSTITDLAYSHTGDRILSASQKDGVVRVWNIGIPTATGRGDKIVFKDKRVTQIVIKLINPFSSKLSKPSRRRPGNAARNASSKVCCDVAAWTHDDSYILTSQSVLVKESGTDIQPGSLFICMWDSKSGRCLISISGAHTSQCQVVLPHPMDASILCTASTDGFVKVWDWTQGKCIFTHRNKNESVQPNNQKKIGGYLDGSFSPDGNIIVLTDDTGEITVLDSITKEDDPPNTSNELVWMREQYFANDYYDLAYDR
jgi:WD40 repeat protein